MNYTPDPKVVMRLTLQTPYSHVWWEEQLHLVLATEVVPEENLEEFARWCVSCADGKVPMTPIWVADMFVRMKNYPRSG